MCLSNISKTKGNIQGSEENNFHWLKECDMPELKYLHVLGEDWLIH